MKMFGMAVMWTTGHRPRRTRLRDSRLAGTGWSRRFSVRAPGRSSSRGSAGCGEGEADGRQCLREAGGTDRVRPAWETARVNAWVRVDRIRGTSLRAALGVRAEDFRVARGEADRDRAVLAFRLRRAIGEYVHRERDEAHDEHIAPHRADCLLVAIGGRRGPCLRRRGP